MPRRRPPAFNFAAAAGSSSVSITFPSVVLFPIDDLHMRRALIGSNASRSYFSFRQGGTLYGVDTTHEGSGAPCTMNASLATATRINVPLASGAQTAVAWATAVVTALTGAGITGVSRNSATVTVAGGSNLTLAPAMTYDPTNRGVWGMQRRSYGPGFDLSTGAMGGTGSVHMTAPASAGRIIAIVMRSSGTASVRLGIANGPAYSTTPAAFSAGVEGASTRGAVDTELCMVRLSATQVRTYTAAQNLWHSFRGVAGGDPGLRYRAHASSPVGRGDIPLNEQLLFSSTTSNPATAIYTAGAYTHGAEAGPYSIYAFVGFVYEIPDANGDYTGRGDIVTAFGKHGVSAAAPTATVGTTMDEETFGMRHPVPWDCFATHVDVDVAARSASEDLGHALYAFGDVVTPSVAGATRLYAAASGFGVTGTGMQRHTYSSPVALAANSIVDVHFNAGNVDGVTPSTTISVNYHPDGGGQQAWLTAWVDDGRAWNDMDPNGGGGYGVQTEYRTRASAGGLMPEGDPTPTWPANFAVNASDDNSIRNHLQHRLYISRTGMVAA